MWLTELNHITLENIIIAMNKLVWRIVSKMLVTNFIMQHVYTNLKKKSRRNDIKQFHAEYPKIYEAPL